MHRRKLLKKALAAFLAVNLIVTSSSMAFAGNNDNNSADVNYENETTDTGSRYVATGYRQLDEEYQIIPDVLSNDNSSIDGMDITKAATYPAAYRTENLPAVRDQGIYGVCWSFSTISLIETNLIKKNLASSDIDLSELHLVNYTYNCVNDPLGGLEGDVNKFDTSYGSVMQYGGNVEMAANSLLDWEGAVNEDVVPYTIDYIRQVENEQLNDSLAYGKDVAHVQNFYRVNITSRDDVKKAVMDYGAVSISYWSDQSSDWSTDNYNSSTAAYYCPNAYTSNHAVTIVGWDDDYSADNFATTPDGNGAWIVRNSWGSYYGKEGYFYLSYYDKSIYTVGYALEAELSNNYDNNYQYDGAMLYGYMGYGGSNKYANIFEAKANQDGSENIKAVSFMTGRSTNLNYTVSIYTNLTDETNPESGTLAAQKSGITTYDGTYTVNLDSPVEINEGNKFSVVVEVRNASGKTSYLAYERSMQSGKVGYWCTASAKENQSFVANPYGYWEDFGKARSCNFIIKAFTDNETQTPVVEVESVSLNKSEMTLTEGESETLAATVTPENAENKSIIWSSNNEAVATVDANGTVIAKRAGTAVITATSTNGKSAGCTVTVEKKQIPVTEVRLSESTVGIVEGSTYKLTATVLPENTTDSKNVSWSSNNEAVATVDANGNVTAKRAGTAVITATSENGKTASCTITVNKKDTNITITEVRLNKSTETLTEGDTTTLTATVLPENTTDSKSVSWSSSNSEVAAVDANGTVTAKSAGTAVITATSTNGKSAGCTVTVSRKEIPITEISLDKSSATLTEGETTTLVATVLPENTTDSKNVSWSSSNSEVATVDANGTVTAKSAGTAVITATSANGKTAGCTVTVSRKEIPITEISLDKSSATLTEGETTTLVATVLPENTTYGKSVKWSSSNVAVATVDLMGKVTAKSAGTAVITATSENGKTASCTVTVNKKDTYTGLRDVDGQLKYFNNGNIDTTYTGFADYEGNRYYVSNGIVDTTYTSLILDNENWVYIENGKVNSDYAGLVNYEGLWFYVDNGTIDWGYTGLADYNGIWFYVSGGMVDWNYAGLTYYNDVWFYISGGMIDWDYTGLVYYNDIWFYVSGGILDWNYIGLTYYNDIWFVISGGMINWDYAGLIYYNDMWFYVSGGTINWDYAGLIYYNDAWFYVSGGCINWTTAIVDYNGAKFYVQNGMVDWDYTGTVNYDGSTYNVINGMVY